MRILVFISIIIASVGLQSCNSTVKSVYRDDFRSASEAEIKNIQKEVGATNSNKSILILTQTYKGEKIIISQNRKAIFSEYPITNLKSRIANYLSVNRNFDVHIKDIFVAFDLCEDNDYSAYKAVIEMANIVKDSAYNVDKIFWLIGSGNYYLHNINIGRNKEQFIKLVKDQIQ